MCVRVCYIEDSAILYKKVPVMMKFIRTLDAKSSRPFELSLCRVSKWPAGADGAMRTSRSQISG